MIDLELAKAIGWTALLAWNLRETVANGKDIVALKSKIENGLTSGLTTLQQQIKGHIDGEEHRIIDALHAKVQAKRRRKNARP